MSEIVGEDWQYQEIPRPAGGWKWKSAFDSWADEETEKAIALFDKGDRYEIEGHKDWALDCDRRALRHLEASWLHKQGLTFARDPSPIGIIPSRYPRHG